MSITGYTLKIKELCDALGSINIVIDDDKMVQICLGDICCLAGRTSHNTCVLPTLLQRGDKVRMLEHDRNRFASLYSATTKLSVCTQKTENDQRGLHDMLSGKPECGKNHDSPQTAENHYERRIQRNREAQRQQPLVPFLRHTMVTMRQRPLSLSHALSVHSYTHTVQLLMFNNFLRSLP